MLNLVLVVSNCTISKQNDCLVVFVCNGKPVDLNYQIVNQKVKPSKHVPAQK